MLTLILVDNVPALEAEMNEIEQTFAVNVFAVMRICKVFAPLLIQAKGTIVQIGSLAGEMPYVFGSVYCATKAALHRYTETLRLELEPFQVRVVNVVTGGVKSQIARTFRTLSKDSVYLPIEADYQARLTHGQDLGMDTDKYARSVVAQLTGWRKRKTIWEGSKSWLVWWLTGYMPRFVIVCNVCLSPWRMLANMASGASYVQDVRFVEAQGWRCAEEASIAPRNSVLKSGGAPRRMFVLTFVAATQP